MPAERRDHRRQLFRRGRRRGPGSRSRGLCGADPVGKTVVRRGRGVGAADGEAVAGGNSQPAREVREVLDRRTARLSRPIRT